MLRPRNFKKDSNLGSIGENRLREKLKKQRTEGKIQYFTDETLKPKSQREDIDFKVVLLDGNEISYECKTDAYGVKSRRVTYEITSHDYAGCLGRSNADYIWYVFVGKDNKVEEEYLISLQEWRHWIGKNSNHIVPHNGGGESILRLYYSEDIGVLQFLCDIDRMVSDGAAKQIS